MHNNNLYELTLSDKLELHELAAKYGSIIDDRNWDALSQIFTEDAYFSVVDFVTMEGLDHIKQFMGSDKARHPLAHLITNIVVEQSEQEARINCQAIFPVSSEGDHNGHRIFYGSYYDKVTKTSDGWRIYHRVFSKKRL